MHTFRVSRTHTNEGYRYGEWVDGMDSRAQSIREERALRGMLASARASYECVAIREFRVGFGDLGFGSL